MSDSARATIRLSTRINRLANARCSRGRGRFRVTRRETARRAHATSSKIVVLERQLNPARARIRAMRARSRGARSSVRAARKAEMSDGEMATMAQSVTSDRSHGDAWQKGERHQLQQRA